MGPVGWFLTLSPKVRWQRRRERRLKRIKIALLIHIDGHCKKDVDFRRVKDWLLDTMVCQPCSTELSQLGNLLLELRHNNFINSNPKDDTLCLTLQGKLELANYKNYAKSLESYETFLSGGRKRLDKFIATIPGRAKFMYSGYTDYCDW